MSVLWLVWVAALVSVVIDMVLRYRRRRLSGRALAVWVVMVAVLPFVGVAAYVVLRLVTLARREPSPG